MFKQWKRVAAGIFCAGLAAGILGGCSTAAKNESDESASSGTSSNETSQQTAGHLNVAMFWVSTSLDPADGYDGWVLSRIGAGETLVKLDENAQAVPCLAESWEQTDENTWVFQIREGVTFSNGSPVDAQACMNAIQRAFDVNSRAGEYFQLESMEADGQTLTISGQTNAQYYQQYSISFFDPWFGGKRPNSFSLSAFFSVQTDISSRYYNSSYYNNYYNSYYSGLGGYGMYNYGNYNNYENYYDPDKSIKMWGLSAGWGKRLNWPDDYFQLSAELSYQRYILKDWQYFPVTNGKCNDLSIGLTLARASYDNPIYPRSGSDFSLSVQFTPPYSLFDGVDYSKYNEYNQNDMNNKWVEYHKWKFKAKTYIPLLNPTVVKKTPVLMTRVEFGILGHYNKYKKSPFGTFDVGGDGMTGYSSYATESVALRGYENSSLTPYRGQEGYAYTRIGFELRYPLMLETSTNIYALTFLEAGNAWHDVKNFNPFDLKRSAGVGVRIFLPMIGMMGIDWAYGFDKVLGDKSAGGSRFHFVLGQEF